MSTSETELLRAIREELDIVKVRLTGSAEGARMRAADGNDIAKSLGSAEGFDYALRVLKKLDQLVGPDRSADV